MQENLNDSVEHDEDIGSSPDAVSVSFGDRLQAVRSVVVTGAEDRGSCNMGWGWGN